MRLAYIGNFINHGKSLVTVGSAIVYALSELSEVESIDVYCHVPNADQEDGYVPDKVNVLPLYDSQKPFSTLNLYSIDWKKYDSVIFNLLPTVFGRSSLINLIGLTAPVALTKLGNRNIKIIYHNSTITNDLEKLGYNSSKDLIRKYVLSRIERLIFRTIPTFMPVRLYVEKVMEKVKGAKVRYVNLRYLEGLASIFINRSDKMERIEKPSNPMPLRIVLLHGYWGPQKNLELAMKTLMDLREEGYYFHLVLSGRINTSFPSYAEELQRMVEKYSSIIGERVEYVPEKDIMWLFLRSDLVLIPYNTPGGHSGVLETAITFDNRVVCVNHPEYAEQSDGLSNVVLCGEQDLPQKLREYFGTHLETISIEVSGKIERAKENLRVIL